MNAPNIPVYEFRTADGRSIGCGTQAELDHWTAEGVFEGVTLGKVIAWEHPDADARRKFDWAREASPTMAREVAGG